VVPNNSYFGKEDNMELEDITDEDYYAAMKIMFHGDGWQLMMLELGDQVALIEDIQTIKSNEELKFKQGQLATIGYLMNFEATLKAAEESKEEDEVVDGSL
jgi:hypothetical protein